MLKLVLPNGSLKENTLRIFEKAQLAVTQNGRCLKGSIDSPMINNVLFTRPQAIPRMIATGICDFGITGMDCVLEYNAWTAQQNHTNEKQIETIVKLPYSRTSLRPARIVLIGTDKAIQSKKELDELLKGKRVYAEHPQWLACMLGNSVMIIPSPGSTEIHIPLEFSFGECITETGKTIHENNLTIISELVESPVVLIANTKRKSKKMLHAIQTIAMQLQSAYQELKQAEDKE